MNSNDGFDREDDSRINRKRFGTFGHSLRGRAPVVALALAAVLLTSSFSYVFSGSVSSSPSSKSFMGSAFATTMPGVSNVVAGVPLTIGSQVPQTLGATAINSGPAPTTDNFNLTQGYKIEPVLWNLTFPSSVTFDDKGNMYVAEAGATLGGVQATPRILKIDANGTVSTLTDRFLAGPVTDIMYSSGKIFVSHHSMISTVDLSNGVVTDIVTGIPSGDHAVDQLAKGSDGRIYAAIGSVTNSGVVGVDNYLPSIGWLASYPMSHDIPGGNITLTGANFDTPNVLADGPKMINATNDMNSIKISNLANATSGYESGNGTGAVSGNVFGNVTTGGFVQFGNSTSPSEKIKAHTICSACIISFDPDGGKPKVVAWGMRLDIFSGLAFDKSGKQLIVADTGAEERGSRPVKNDHDKIWKIDMSTNSSQPQWYGWPDYFFAGNGSKNLQPATDPIFQSPRSSKPLQFLINEHPQVPPVFADPGYARKLTQAVLVDSNSSFGLHGKMLIGEYGTHAPTTHDFSGTGIKQYIPGDNGTKILGQKVIALDTETGNMTDFLSLKNPDPSFRPVGLSFSPDHNALYVVSIGKSEHRTTLPNGAPLPAPQIWSYRDTGVVWRITKAGSGLQNAEMPPSKLNLDPGLLVTANSGPAPNSTMLDVPPGYTIKPILWNLNLPGPVAFDDQGNMYIGETGYAYVGLVPPPVILKVDHQSGNVSVFVDRGLDRVLTGITFHNGKLYVSNGGRISTVDMQGRVQTIIAALPGIGDHYVDQMAFGSDGRMYFGVGTATNSGVVGRDNPWVKATPEFHDIPGKNITLTGQNFRTENFFEIEKNGTFPQYVTTGTYSPFGTPTYPGEIIKGDNKCTGCILSANPDGTDVKVVGWGLRHPYGMEFAQDGKHLIVSMNSVDERGSRNVANSGDPIYSVDITNSSDIGRWYGWPDYFGAAQPVTDPQFSSPRNFEPLQPLIQNPPPVKSPLQVTPVGTALTDVAPVNDSSQFGYAGKMMIGSFGTLAPQTHLTAVPEKTIPGSVMGQIIGQNVVALDPANGTYENFVSLKTGDSTFRPTGVAFSNDGNTLYISSVAKNEVRSTTPQGGVLPFTYGLPWAYPLSGVIWKVTRDGVNGESLGSNQSLASQSSANSTSAGTFTSLYTNPANSNNTMLNNKNAQSNNQPTTQPLTYPANAQVNIILGAALARDKAFDPNPVHVLVNGSVTWTNKDTVVHTVTSGDGFGDPNMGAWFDSGLLGGTFSHRFNETGTYNYFCQIHPTMTGQVIVEPSGSSIPSKSAGGVGGE